MSPPRARRQRREQERALRKGVRAVERLARQLPGATPETAVEVDAPAVAEIKARATACPQCGGELEVRRLGFGAMRIVKDRAEGVRVVRRAVGLGVNFIDTADIYGAGVSE